MAGINEIKSELQITTADISDADISYALGKVGGNFNLACAAVLRMLLRKNRGRKHFKLSTFSETVSQQEFRSQIRYYMDQAGAASGVTIDEPDYIFTVEGM